MKPFNATVKTGFIGRDCLCRLWVQPDKGALVQVIHDGPLDEGKRVKLEAGKIVAVQ